MSSPSDKPTTGLDSAVSTPPPGFRDPAGTSALVTPPVPDELPSHHWSRRFARPAILYAAPKPMDLLRALQRRWLLALTVGLLLTVPTVAITWLMISETYQTYSMLRVRQGAGILYPINSEVYSFAAQKQLIQSAVVINAATEERDVRELPWVKSHAGTEVEWLASQIDVRLSGELMQIGMSGSDPSQLAVLVNAITKAYLSRVAGDEHRQLLKRHDMIALKYDFYAKLVQSKRDLLYKLARRIGSADSETVQAKQQLLADYVMSLRKDITSHRFNVMQKEQQLILFKRKNGLTGDDKAAPPEELVDELVAQDPDYQSKLAQIKKAQEYLDDLLRVSKDKNSMLVQHAKEAVAKMKTLAEQRRKEVRDKLMQDIKDGKLVTRVRAELDQLTGDLTSERAILAEMETQFTVYSKQCADLETSSSDLDEHKEALARVLPIANSLGMELEKIELELGSGERVTKLEDARVPKSAQDSHRKNMAGMFGLCALAVGLGGVSLLEFHARRITSPVEVDEGLGVRVIGDVPMLSRRPRRWLGYANGVAIGALQNIMDESIDGVRAMLLHSAGGDAVRVVMVTSAKAGEGKTTIAVSLAASLGRCGRRTLLIDGDLRRPNVHRLLELPLDKGLSEVLRGEASVQEVIRPSRAAGMWVMSAGQCDQVSLQALTKNTVAQIFESLRTEFDSIVIDSGPVLAVVDPLLLGQHCDGAVVSIVHRVSQITPVYETLERLRTTGIRVLGCVVNGTTHSGLSLGHGYYGYGYGYGYVNGNGQAGQPTNPPADQTS